MNDIANKAIVLKLNKHWKIAGVGVVDKTICDLMSGVVDAMDIVYKINPDGTPNFEEYEYFNPLAWEDWIKLPVRSWDLSIHSTRMHIRVPTVVITRNYAKVHEKKFKGKPTKEGLFIRDNGTNAYTGEELPYEEATIDHVLPLSRGGEDSYNNTVLTSKVINNRKGNRLNSEVGLTLLINPHTPSPIKVSQTIRKARHHDWTHFLPKGKL